LTLAFTELPPSPLYTPLTVDRMWDVIKATPALREIEAAISPVLCSLSMFQAGHKETQWRGSALARLCHES